MKKLKYLLMLFVLMIVVPTDVLGELASDNKHILTIEGININNSNITFDGYSFISHMDNWGIDSSGYGNLKTYMIAYVRSRESDIFAVDSYGNQTLKDFSTKNIGACEEKEYCYYKIADVVENRSFFYSRCTDKGCDLYDEIKTDRKTRGFINNNKCNDDRNLYNSSGTLSGSKYDDECLYENVGFRVTVNVQSVVEKFTKGDFKINYGNVGDRSDDIVFKILVVNTDTGDNIATSFNVHENVCYVNGVKCNSKNITSASYNFSLSEFATSVYFDAVSSVPYILTITDKETSFDRLSGYHFKAGVDYSLKKYYTSLNKSKEDNDCANGYCGDYTDAFVELKVKKGSDSLLYPDGSSSLFYLAPANHVILNGEFSIDSFKILAEPLQCSDISNINSTNSSEKSIKCGNGTEFSQCSVTGSNGNSIVGEIYYLDSKYTPDCSMENYVTDSNGNHYLKVKVMADLLIYQTGKFQFGTFTPDVIKAGKGFSVDSSGISYNNSVGFIIAGRYNNPADSTFYNTPFISYSASKLKKITVGGKTMCGIDTTFNIDDEIRKYYKETANGSSPFYFKNADGSFTNANALNVSILAISDKFFSEHVVNYDNNRNNDKNLNNIFKFKSCDSNSSKAYCINADEVDVKGVWKKTLFTDKYTRLDASNNLFIADNGVSPYDSSYYRGFGKIFESTYVYNLPYAYVALSDMTYDGTFYKYADVVYSTTPIANSMSYNLRPVGNKYFVGLKYVYANSSGYDFPFDLKRSNISFVDDLGMTWMLSGTCGVDVGDGYYTCDDPGGCDGSGDKTKLNYKYRSINVKAPFPKFNNSNYVNAATNWQDWYWTSINREINRQRLSNSYNTLDYSVTFSKYPDASKLDITEIINCSKTGATGTCSSGYGSMTNFGYTGSPEVSRFVNKYFNVTPTDNKYCGLGLFSPSCDK